MAELITCPSCQLKHSPRADGVCPKCKSSASGFAPANAESQFFENGAASPEAPPASGGAGKAAVAVIGGVIFVVGAGLFIGNVTGLFPTFPFAGYATMALGGVLSRVGSGGGDA